jgi:hypothetical protein
LALTLATSHHQALGLALLGPLRLGSLLRLGPLDFRPSGLGGCAWAQLRQSRLDPTELGFELLDLVLHPLAGLGAPGLLVLHPLAGLRAPGFLALLALAKLFPAAFDHAPLGLAVVSIARRGQAAVAGRIGLLVDAFRPGHALLGSHRREVAKPHCPGDHLGDARVAAGLFVGDQLSH